MDTEKDNSSIPGAGRKYDAAAPENGKATVRCDLWLVQCHCLAVQCHLRAVHYDLLAVQCDFAMVHYDFLALRCHFSAVQYDFFIIQCNDSGRNFGIGAMGSCDSNRWGSDAKERSKLAVSTQNRRRNDDGYNARPCTGR